MCIMLIFWFLSLKYKIEEVYKYCLGSVLPRLDIVVFMVVRFTM